MRSFALAALGRDRPGIVAGVSAVLLRHALNIEDSQMTILRGRFTMMLIVSGADGTDAAALERDLRQAGAELGLEAVSLSEVPALPEAGEVAPTHIVTVYGVDHPGIVRAVTAALAAAGANITDLNTRLVGDGALYAMMLEVELPPGLAEHELERRLAAVAGEQGLEASVRPLEQDRL